MYDSLRHDTWRMNERTFEAGRKRTVTRLDYDHRAVPEVALLLGVEAGLAPFKLAGAEVHRMTVTLAEFPALLVLTLWPSIQRVDAISPQVTVVFTQVDIVELVEGVEVIFRRRSGEYLIVTIGGKVIVRA